MTKVLVLAKAPIPGRSKTRLCPPCTPEQAAMLAEAALVDTLETVSATACDRRVLILRGEPGPWLPAGFDIISQRGSGLDERLAAGFEDAGDGPSLLIGMDTPQVSSWLLEGALAALDSFDAAIGAAQDGGWWALGLRRPDPRVFLGIPMSTSSTGAAQRARLSALGLSFRELASLRDVDFMADAEAVAREIPRSHFAQALLRTRRSVPA